MVTKAEFAISEVEYTMDKYEGAPCHEYANLDGEKPEFYGFKECSKAVIRYNFLSMTGFEPQISGKGSDRSVNWATTTAQIIIFILSVAWNESN